MNVCIRCGEPIAVDQCELRSLSTNEVFVIDGMWRHQDGAVNSHLAEPAEDGVFVPKNEKPELRKLRKQHVSVEGAQQEREYFPT